MITGDHEMNHWWIAVTDVYARHRTVRAPKRRGARRVELSCQSLEERVTPSHAGATHHLAAAAKVHREVGHHSGKATNPVPTTPPISTVSAPLPGSGVGNTPPSSTSAGWHGRNSGGNSKNSALQTALQNLSKEVQTIELASGTTVGELTAIQAAFQTLGSDKLFPNSYSGLQSFENSLVTQSAAGTLATNQATLLSQFIALYTSTPTSSQTTDLTTAYNALAAAVTSSKINSTDISTLSTDWSAVLAAINSKSTATFPYFTLVTSQGVGPWVLPMQI